MYETKLFLLCFYVCFRALIIPTAFKSSIRQAGSTLDDFRDPRVHICFRLRFLLNETNFIHIKDKNWCEIQVWRQTPSSTSSSSSSHLHHLYHHIRSCHYKWGSRSQWYLCVFVRVFLFICLFICLQILSTRQCMDPSWCFRCIRIKERWRSQSNSDIQWHFTLTSSQNTDSAEARKTQQSMSLNYLIIYFFIFYVVVFCSVKEIWSTLPTLFVPFSHSLVYF